MYIRHELYCRSSAQDLFPRVTLALFELSLASYIVGTSRALIYYFAERGFLILGRHTCGRDGLDRTYVLV